MVIVKPQNTGILNTVIDDQVGYFQDMFTWKFMVPSIVALGLLGGGIAEIIINAREMHKDEHETEKEKDQHTHLMILGAILFAVGLVILIVVKMILFIRHPRAGVEQMGADMVLNAFQS